MKVFNKEKTLENIRAIMEEKCITQKQLSKVMNLSVYAVSRKINGWREFTLKEIIIVSEMLETDLNDLLKFDVI